MRSFFLAPRQGCQIGVRFDTQDARMLRIDGKNGSPKRIADQVPKKSTPNAIGLLYVLSLLTYSLAYFTTTEATM